MGGGGTAGQGQRLEAREDRVNMTVHRIVRLADGREVGDGSPCIVVAEQGINNDGDLDKALALCRAAKLTGADYVKLQKKSPRLSVPESQWGIPKETPWGEILPYLTYKERMEFGRAEFDAIDQECRRIGLPWFASAWDLPSLEFLLAYAPPAIKVPSACLTDIPLLEAVRASGVPAILSVGMSTKAQISRAVAVLGPDRLVILWCRSSYPADPKDLNLTAILTLRDRYPICPIGWSGHETGLYTSLCAVVLGASMVERHFTLDRAAKGTDHAVSVEPKGMTRLIQAIRRWEEAQGTGELDGPIASELPILAKLRKFP